MTEPALPSVEESPSQPIRSAESLLEDADSSVFRMPIKISEQPQQINIPETAETKVDSGFWRKEPRSDMFCDVPSLQQVFPTSEPPTVADRVEPIPPDPPVSLPQVSATPRLPTNASALRPRPPVPVLPEAQQSGQTAEQPSIWRKVSQIIFRR